MEGIKRYTSLKLKAFVRMIDKLRDALANEFPTDPSNWKTGGVRARLAKRC